MEKLVKEFLYYERFGQQKSENTIKSYKKDLEQFLEFIIGHEMIESIGEVEELNIRGFVLHLTSVNITKRSQSRKLSTLRTFFKYLKEKNIINKNPMLLLNNPTFKNKFPILLNKNELDRLREAIDITKTNGIRDRLILELLYSSGIRASELLSLGENVIDLEEREMKIAGNSSRTVFFSSIAKKYLLKYLERKKLKYKEKYNLDIIFVNGSGTRLSDRSLRRIIGRYAEKSKIEKEISPHTFRHTFGVYMLENGMNIHHLQELMGHSSFESTRIYEEHMIVIRRSK
ncbi:MAG: tyrosine-type recombinase/integrase [Psychrilyobacter sp.]|nr:tyrosine-type recombinase/integrase [Psychrilyobacter sp.]